MMANDEERHGIQIHKRWANLGFDQLKTFKNEYNEWSKNKIK